MVFGFLFLFQLLPALGLVCVICFGARWWLFGSAESFCFFSVGLPFCLGNQLTALRTGVWQRMCCVLGGGIRICVYIGPPSVEGDPQKITQHLSNVTGGGAGVEQHMAEQGGHFPSKTYGQVLGGWGSDRGLLSCLN